MNQIFDHPFFVLALAFILTLCINSVSRNWARAFMVARMVKAGYTAEQVSTAMSCREHSDSADSDDTPTRASAFDVRK